MHRLSVPLALLALLALPACGQRDTPAPSTPAPATAAPASTALLGADARRSLITQRLAARHLQPGLRTRVVESWVAGSEGLDQAGMDRLLAAMDGSIAAVDETRFNAAKDLAEGRPCAAGTTLIGALIGGLVAETGGRQPIAIDCGGIRATGWVERSAAHSRATVIITSMALQDANGRISEYRRNDGLAYVIGPDGLQGLTLQAVTDQRGNSWLGLQADTLVTLILTCTVDRSLLVEHRAGAPASAPATPAPRPAAPAGPAPVAPTPAPVAPAPAAPAAAESVPAAPATPPAPPVAGTAPAAP